MDEQSWRVRDIAERLNIARETVLRLLHNGKLHGFKAGRDWRVKESELQRFEAQRGEVRHPRKLDAFSDLNMAIAPGGECTRDAEKDQLRRETQGRDFISPVNPDEAIPDDEHP
jgi:excisionase family DNA binding protein